MTKIDVPKAGNTTAKLSRCDSIRSLFWFETALNHITNTLLQRKMKEGDMIVLSRFAPLVSIFKEPGKAVGDELSRTDSQQDHQGLVIARGSRSGGRGAQTAAISYVPLDFTTWDRSQPRCTIRGRSWRPDLHLHLDVAHIGHSIMPSQLRKLNIVQLLVNRSSVI